MEIIGEFDKENKKAEKVLKTLRKLKDYIEIQSSSMTVSYSGIGTNVMLNVKVIMKQDDYSVELKTLHFDVTDYDAW